MIHLHTLGDTLIKVGAKEVRPTSPMLFAALLYLGMERGRRVPRAALQELLFPESDERSGAHSLRQLLYKLRQLGAPIEGDAQSVLLGAEHVRDDTAPAGTNEIGAADISEGFLPDYAPKLSERFTEWLEQKRSLITAELRNKLVATIAATLELMNWSAVERHARSLLRVDPYNEVGIMALAEAMALSGGKAAAIRLLAQYEQELGRSDLSLPAAVLRKRIMQSIPEPPGRLAQMPFVGRESEAQELRKHVLMARAGSPSLFVIGGEPGIGKTRLLEETTSLAALDGVNVQVVRCQSHYASRPLSVFIELVPAMRNCRGALGVSPESLSRLNMLTSHTDAQVDRPADHRDDLTRAELLAGAVRDLVDAVASERPLLIGIEDAHWADADSLRELNRLVHGGSGRALMVICTTRLPEAFPAHTGLEDRMVVRRLKPLTAEPMGELAARLLPRVPEPSGADVVSWCVRTAAGNPLFLQMLCAHYSATGEPYAVPPDMRSAIERRLERLPLPCRRILEFSALLGRHATLESLRLLTESSHVQLLDSIHLLEREGYLVAERDAVRLSHDLLSDTALGMVPPVTRRVLHGCVAAMLEHRYDATDDAGLLWDCAEQWRLAGDNNKARQFLKRCARHATRIGSAGEALKLLERAKELATYPAEVADTLGEMMLAARAAGRWDTANEISKRLEATRWGYTSSGEHTEHEFVTAEVGWFVRGDRRVVNHARQCLGARDATAEHRTAAARLLLVISHELCDEQLAQNAYDAARPFLEERSVCFENRFIPLHFHSVFGDRDIALQLGQTLSADLDLFDVCSRMRVIWNTTVALMFIGAYDDAFSVSQRGCHEAEALGLNTWLHDLRTLACSVLITQEDYEAALSWHDLADRLRPSTSRGSLTSVHLANELELALWRGNVRSGRATLAAISAIGYDNFRLKAYLLALETRLNQLDETYRMEASGLAQLLELYERTKRFACADSLTVAIGEALIRDDRIPTAQALLAEYVSHARRERGPIPPSLQTLLARVHARISV